MQKVANSKELLNKRTFLSSSLKIIKQHELRYKYGAQLTRKAKDIEERISAHFSEKPFISIKRFLSKA